MAPPGYKNRYDFLRELFPILDTKDVDGRTVIHRVVSLNDDLQWPREKIALEYVKKIEEEFDERGEIIRELID